MNKFKENPYIQMLGIASTNWKPLLISALIGACLGFCGWAILGKYTARISLINQHSKLGMNLLTWKVLEKNLPNTASQLIMEGVEPFPDRAALQLVSQEAWWRKDVQIQYLVSRADTKEFVGVDKKFDEASSEILSIWIEAKESSRQKAVDTISVIADFILNGASYVEVQGLLTQMNSFLVVNQGQQKVREQELAIELKNATIRLKELESLRRRYPSSVTNTFIGGDTKTKFLPLNDQIVIASLEISGIHNELIDSQNQQKMYKNLRHFLERARAVKFKGIYDSNYVDTILSILSEEEEGASDSPLTLIELQKFKTSMLLVVERHKYGISRTQPIVFNGKGFYLSIISGAFIGVLILLLWTFTEINWRNKQ